MFNRNKIKLLLIPWILLVFNNFGNFLFANPINLTDCDSTDQNNWRVLFVSTLDGKLRALNLTSGKLLWEASVGSGSLLSSNLHSLEFVDNGEHVKLIPSLNGEIYKFNGELIDKAGINADNYLDFDFKLSDSVVTVGGKETELYGVSLKTGKILYQCSKEKCISFTRHSEENLDGNDAYNYIKNQPDVFLDRVLLVKRQTKMVRALEPVTGDEYWNFSVGYHELEILQNQHSSEFNFCANDILNSLDIRIKINAIEGTNIISAYSKDNPYSVAWEYKIDVPIANVWRTDIKNNFHSVEVKDIHFCESKKHENMLITAQYLGIYRKQPYIQEANYLNAFDHFEFDSHQITGFDLPLKLTSDLDENALSENLKHGDICYKEVIENGKITSKNKQSTDKTDKALMTLTSKYSRKRFSNIFIREKDSKKTSLGSCLSCNQQKKLPNISWEEHILDQDNSNKITIEVIFSIWYWWKEIIVISLTTGLLINLFVPKLHKGDKILIIEKHVSVSENTNSTDKTIVSNHSNPENFVSRFQLDFDIINCIGKGGFGVVFEVKNKLDNCCYAIKKIVLPNRIERRNRVMREVRTLADCEHPNIVRYFQAWTETPPPGWMEENYKTYEIESEATSLDCELTSEASDLKNHIMKKYKINSVFEISNNNSFDKINEIKQEVFNIEGSGSNSYDNNISQNDAEDSFEIAFENTSEQIIFSNKKSSMSQDSSSIIKTISKLGKAIPSISKNFRNSSTSADSPLKLNQNRVYLYIQMQLCRKDSLREWLRDNILENRVPFVQMYFEQIVDAVCYVHQKGLIHRDLKPSNIFFSQHGQIKIGDFGLATLMQNSTRPDIFYEDEEISDSQMVNYLSTHTKHVGTYLYMSPEQIKGNRYDHKVDIYSLGLIMFEMLVYFPTEMERIASLTALREKQFPKNFTKQFPEELELLKEMLSSLPRERPESVQIKNKLQKMSSWVDAKMKHSNINNKIN